MPIPLVTRILVADDHPIVRSGLKKVLDAQPDLEVVAEAEDGAEAVKKALAEDVHLAILDVVDAEDDRDPGRRGAAQAQARAEAPDALDVRQRAVPVRVAARRAPPATCSSPTPTRTSSTPVRRTMRGQSFLYPSAISTLVNDFVERGRPDDQQFDILTPRELQVLKLIAEAHTSKEIAEELVISIKTVERHRQNILDKLGMSDRVELTRYAIRRGLIQP